MREGEICLRQVLHSPVRDSVIRRAPYPTVDTWREYGIAVVGPTVVAVCPYSNAVVSTGHRQQGCANFILAAPVKDGVLVVPIYPSVYCAANTETGNCEHDACNDLLHFIPLSIALINLTRVLDEIPTPCTLQPVMQLIERLLQFLLLDYRQVCLHEILIVLGQQFTQFL